MLFAFPEAGECNDCIFTGANLSNPQPFDGATIVSLKMGSDTHFLDANVVNPSFEGLYHPFLVKFGMVYY